MNRREILKEARNGRESIESVINHLKDQDYDDEENHHRTIQEERQKNELHSEVRAARAQANHKQEEIERLNERIQGLESELDDKRATIRDLKEQREAQEMALEAERRRVDKKESEVELLKNQLKSTMSQNLANAEEFNWHGMMKTEQYWRPPYHEEIMDLGRFLEWNLKGDFSTNFSEESKHALQNSYVVVLDHYVSDSPAYAGKLMFVVHGFPEYHNVFIWDEEGLCPVSMASETENMNREFLDYRNIR